MVGADALAVCRAHRGLPVGFLLLRYSVLFTVESLSLLDLLLYLDLNVYINPFLPVGIFDFYSELEHYIFV